jgi:uncharacterized metal-binding protein
MATWVKEAQKILMLDGCFLKCPGRVLNNLIAEEKVVHIEVLPFYRKYNDVFLIEDVPEGERKAVAREVADKILAKLKQDVPLQGITQ